MFLDKTWLYTIGRNVAIDYLRKSKRSSFLPIDNLQNVLSDEGEFEKSYLQEERKIAVHKALGKLNTEYREILYLIYFEDFSNSEAAKTLNKSKRQIENLIYRARNSLKAELNKEGFVYEEL